MKNIKGHASMVKKKKGRTTNQFIRRFLMRIRVGRVAIVLATALPLLANDIGNAIPEESSEVIGEPIHNDERDGIPLTAIQAIHPTSSEQTYNPEVPESTRAVKDKQHTENKEGKDSKDEGSDRETERGNTNTHETEAAEDQIGNASSFSISPKDDSTANPQHKTAKQIVHDSDGKNSWPNVSTEDALVEPGDNITGGTNTTTSKSVDEKKDGKLIETESQGEISTIDDDKNTPVDDPTELTKESEADEEKEITVLDEDEFKLRERVAVDYASKSAGALVIEQSGSFKGTSNLLNGDRDKYAIAPCEENKFVVVSLSEDILVRKIKLANYERFSSTAKEFQVMGSQTMDTWVDLGTYTAKSGNGEQLFELVEPAWARYLKFKFLSHHGLEYYCTYSQIKVHGSTMVQGFHEQWVENEENEMLADSDDEADSIIDGQEQSTQNETYSNESTKAETDGKDNIISETVAVDKLGSDGKLREGGESSEPTVPNVRQLAIPSALDAALQGKRLRKDSFYESHDLKPSVFSYLPQISRESPGRRTVATLMHSKQPFDNKKQRNNASLRSATSTSDVAAADAPGISSPKMSDSLERTMRSVLDRFAAARTITSVLYPEPKKSNIKPELVAEADEMIDESPISKAVGSIVEEKGEAKAESDKINTAETDNKNSPVKEKENPISGANASSASNQESITSDPEKTEDTPEVPLVADTSLAKLLVGLPSAECLGKLDFAYFKAKALRKATSGSGSSNAVGSMEPIFKKLTDEIKALQTNVSIQDQFTKASVACYQRVLFDLILEMEKTRHDQNVRLAKLEEELHSSEAMSWRLLYSLSSLFTVFYSIVFAWNSAVLGYWVKLCSWLYGFSNYLFVLAFKYFIQSWPRIKSTITSFGSDYPDKVSPLVDKVDSLVEDFESAGHREQAPALPENALDGFTITISIVPIITAFLLYWLFLYMKATLNKQEDAKPIPQNRPPKKKVPVVSPEKDANETEDDRLPELMDERGVPSNVKILLENRA
jgi:hypothetical protein